VGAAHFLKELVVVLGTAALTTVIFQKLRQPVVLGYLLAGLLIGPYTPTGVVADERLVRVLSELGVILLMFSIGLEFSIRRIARVGAGAALTSAIEVGLMLSLGFVAGQLLGFSDRESLFSGACLAISSTMLVSKTFEERRTRDPLTGTVFAVLVFEDLYAIILLALLTGVATHAGVSGVDLAIVGGKLVGFLLALLILGLLLVPRAIRLVARLDRAETLLVTTMAVCFGMALLAEEAGFSVALGAFLAGMLVSESGEGAQVEPLILPFRDVFAAVFFVAIGMSIDPGEVAGNVGTILVLSVVVILGKLAGVTVGAFLAGNGLVSAIRAGLSLGQIGEFSFILAGVGVAAGVVRPFFLPVIVAVSCLTALTTPWMWRVSERLARFIDAHLPRTLQTFVSFYGTWIEGIRASRGRDTLWRRLRRSVLLLLVDATLLGATVVATAIYVEPAGRFLDERFALGDLARPLVIATAVAVASVFAFGVLRRARRLGRNLAAEVLPPSPQGKLDLGTAPRRALVLTLELAIVLAVGLPLVAVIQNFVRAGAVALGIIVAVIGFAVWRSITNLEGHVRAGSELIVETLARQSRATTATPELEEVRELLPGIPGLTPVRLAPNSGAIGRSLAEVNLRALTGATVLAIQRAQGGAVLPSPVEILRAGDVLALAGPPESIEAAARLLGAP
jgi:monovalent cation:H+ antiporter-2, CPA2 family